MKSGGRAEVPFCLGAAVVDSLPAHDTGHAVPYPSASSANHERIDQAAGRPVMSPLTTGVLYGAATLAVVLRRPDRFCARDRGRSFLYFFMPAAALDTVAQNVYEEMGNIVILSIPLFILKGAAIGRTDAGRDIYRALHAWLQRIPGGLGIANTVACGLFAAIWFLARDLLGYRIVRPPGNAQAGLFRGVRGRHHRGRWHAWHLAAALHYDDPLCSCRRSLAE